VRRASRLGESASVGLKTKSILHGLRESGALQLGETHLGVVWRHEPAPSLTARIDRRCARLKLLRFVSSAVFIGSPTSNGSASVDGGGIPAYFDGKSKVPAQGIVTRL
jgi:hypothetical protein